MGLALLHQEQDKKEQCRDPDEVLPHSPSSPIVSTGVGLSIHPKIFSASIKLINYNLCVFALQAEDLEAELEKAAHCMQFAIAAYGWPMYVYSNPLTGACKLSGDW